MPLEDMFTTWVRYIYLVVGMENALENDYDFARLSSTAGEDHNELTPFNESANYESFINRYGERLFAPTSSNAYTGRYTDTSLKTLTGFTA